MSSLESAGWMAGLNERLARDRGLADRMRGAIALYRRERDSLEHIEDGGAPPGGGPDRIKCLHAHVAHELARSGNAVGARALAAAGWPDCDEACFQVKVP